MMIKRLSSILEKLLILDQKLLNDGSGMFLELDLNKYDPIRAESINNHLEYETGQLK